MTTFGRVVSRVHVVRAPRFIMISSLERGILMLYVVFFFPFVDYMEGCIGVV